MRFSLTPKRKKILLAGLLLLTLGFVAGGYALYLQVSGNFHTVVEGTLYRSAQPTKKQIIAYQKKYGIRTILNLRGTKEKAAWYRSEVHTAMKLGLTHIDFRMSARTELTQEDAIKLVDILRHAPKPILVHCNSGSDRTGLAAALFLAAIAQKSEGTAEGQLSFFYGHVAIPLISVAYAMDKTFEKLEPWLGFDGS